MYCNHGLKRCNLGLSNARAFISTLFSLFHIAVISTRMLTSGPILRLAARLVASWQDYNKHLRIPVVLLKMLTFCGHYVLGVRALQYRAWWHCSCAKECGMYSKLVKNCMQFSVQRFAIRSRHPWFSFGLFFTVKCFVLHKHKSLPSACI